MCIGGWGKVSLAPFHIWLPDIYEGIPDIITAYLAIVPKIGIIGLLAYLYCFVITGNDDEDDYSCLNISDNDDTNNGDSRYDLKEPIFTDQRVEDNNISEEIEQKLNAIQK